MPEYFHPNPKKESKRCEFSIKGEYLKIRIVLDEQISEQKDSIEVMNREALSE